CVAQSIGQSSFRVPAFRGSGATGPARGMKGAQPRGCHSLIVRERAVHHAKSDAGAELGGKALGEVEGESGTHLKFVKRSINASGAGKGGHAGGSCAGGSAAEDRTRAIQAA